MPQFAAQEVPAIEPLHLQGIAGFLCLLHAEIPEGGFICNTCRKPCSHK